eukprot:g26004.t1
MTRDIQLIIAVVKKFEFLSESVARPVIVFKPSADDHGFKFTTFKAQAYRSLLLYRYYVTGPQSQILTCATGGCHPERRSTVGSELTPVILTCLGLIF